jgi:hypothetical protein
MKGKMIRLFLAIREQLLQLDAEPIGNWSKVLEDTGAKVE